MKVEDILVKLKFLNFDRNKLIANLMKLNRATIKRWNGKFVQEVPETNPAYTQYRITDEGKAELDKYGIRESTQEELRSMKPIVKQGCFICGSDNVCNYAQMSVYTFRVCPKHSSFLPLCTQLRYKDDNK